MRKRVLFFVFLGASFYTLACTTFIAGKDATEDNSIIIARNVDYPDAITPFPMQFNKKLDVPRAFVPSKVMNDKFKCTIPAGSMSCFSFPLALTRVGTNFSCEENGINDAGVAMSATESIFSSKRMLNDDPFVNTGVNEDCVTSVVFPQIRSAREGVEMLGKLIAKYGSSEGFGVAFADKNECWYLENAGGHHWLAQRIPDDCYFISANQGRLKGSIDLIKSEDILASSDIVDFAVSHGYCESEADFNFAKCYMDNEDWNITYNYSRVRRVLNLISGASAEDTVFMKPEKKITLEQVKKIMRDHYDEANDPYFHRDPVKYSNRPIAVFRTSLSHINQIRPGLSLDIGHIDYVAFGFTDISVYFPFYKGLGDNIPRAYNIGTTQIDDDSIFWMFRKLQTLVMEDYPNIAPKVKQAIRDFEEKIRKEQEKMEKEYLMYCTNEEAARKCIIDHTNQWVKDEIKFLKEQIDEYNKGKYNNDKFLSEMIKIEKQYHFAAHPG